MAKAKQHDIISGKVTEIDFTQTDYSESEKLDILREKRNAKLAETDWWASADVTLTDERKAYRKTLRDLPSTMTQNSDFDSFTWPTKPS